MSIKVPAIGLTRLLTILVSNWGTLTVHLYSNAVVPGDADTLATYQECAFPGYAAQNVPNWSAPVTDNNGRYTSTGGTVTFTLNAGGTAYNAYGYYVTDSGNNLLWAEQFANAPEVLQNANQQLQVSPTFTDRSEY